MSAPNYQTPLSYITYKCNKCARTLDVRQDNLRVFINNCTITQHCQGKLSPISAQRMRSVVAASVDNALTNWTPSNQSVAFQQVPTFEYLNTGAEVITLAVLEDGFMPTNFSMAFNISSSVSDYLEYNYSLTFFTQIIGVDLNSNTLRFTNVDNVLVYINGVLQDATTYSLVYNATVGYAITLQSAIIQTSAVRIIVYSPVAIHNTNAITFTRHDQNNYTSAWSSVYRIYITDPIKAVKTSYILYSSNQLSNLVINTRLNLLPGTNNLPNSLILQDFYFLLANPNYTSVDRNLLSIVNLNNITSNENYLNVSLSGSTYAFECTSASVIPVLPLSIDWASLLPDTSELATNLTLVSNAGNVNAPTISNVIGPI